jgi:hypothetical protein
VLTIAHVEEPLAQYTVVREADHQHLREVTPLRQFETNLRSAQLPLWTADTVEWRLAIQRRQSAPRRRRSLLGTMQRNSLAINRRVTHRVVIVSKAYVTII